MFAHDDIEEGFDLSFGTQPAGRGILELSFVAGRTEVTRAFAANPLRLLVPRRRDRGRLGLSPAPMAADWWPATKSTCSVRIGARARGVLGTQASTKVYRSPGEVPCRQMLRASVADGGLLVLAPDPLTCFAAGPLRAIAKHPAARQRQPGAGRLAHQRTAARGESWAMSRYRSRLRSLSRRRTGPGRRLAVGSRRRAAGFAFSAGAVPLPGDDCFNRRTIGRGGRGLCSPASPQSPSSGGLRWWTWPARYGTAWSCGSLERRRKWFRGIWPSALVPERIPGRRAVGQKVVSRKCAKGEL